MIVIDLLSRNQLVVFKLIYILINCNNIFTIIKEYHNYK